MIRKKQGLILMSVFNKKGISKFAKILKSLGYKIIATDGTGRELATNGIPFVPSNKISKNPEKLEDCIKTISFRIEAGILFDRLNAIEVKQAKDLSVEQIDMVVCNFPPLEQVITSPIDFNVKNIDVGGPLMVRAAATNFKYVLVVVDPNDYEMIAKRIIKGKITSKFRQKLAIKAFTYTNSYDNKIIKYLGKNIINL